MTTIVSDNWPPHFRDIAIDCTDVDAILPFWKVGLDYRELVAADGTELIDPRGQGPRVWFQHMELPRTQRNRIHLDVYVPTAIARQPMAARRAQR